MNITYCYTNQSSLMRKYHEDNCNILRETFGFNVKSICLTDLHPHFYHKELKNVKKTKEYLKYCNTLTKKLQNTDVLIHKNGTMIPLEVLRKFSFKKIFQCSDDFKSYGSGLNLISKPVAKNYDYCAVSNIDCLDVYEKWGCENVFWHPLGSSFYNKKIEFNKFKNREKKAVFIGERNGVPYPILGRLFGMYRRKGFFDKFEKSVTIPFEGYGKDWDNGFVTDNEMIDIMSNNCFGVNKHGFPGSVNHRMYDMCSFGILQFCDNKSSLSKVYKLDEEIIGYDSIKELNEKLIYYKNNLKAAEEIAYNGFQKFNNEYSREKILEKMLKNSDII